jgi:hypothetical protein
LLVVKLILTHQFQVPLESAKNYQTVTELPLDNKLFSEVALKRSTAKLETLLLIEDFWLIELLMPTELKEYFYHDQKVYLFFNIFKL